jgi:Zn-dependent protease
LTLNPVKHLDFFGSFLLPVILKLTGASILFGWAKPVPVNFSRLSSYRKATLLVSAAGVLANLGLAVVSAALFQGLAKSGAMWGDSLFRPVLMELTQMLGYSVMINSVLAIFNLIPIPPLDGSKILAVLLPEPARMIFVRIERFGMIIIILLLFTGSLSRFMSFFIAPLIDFLLGN